MRMRFPKYLRRLFAWLPKKAPKPGESPENPLLVKQTYPDDLGVC